MDNSISELESKLVEMRHKNDLLSNNLDHQTRKFAENEESLSFSKKTLTALEYKLSQSENNLREQQNQIALSNHVKIELDNKADNLEQRIEYLEQSLSAESLKTSSIGAELRMNMDALEKSRIDCLSLRDELTSQKILNSSLSEQLNRVEGLNSRVATQLEETKDLYENAMEELKAEMKLLNWHKLANESALKVASHETTS